MIKLIKATLENPLTLLVWIIYKILYLFAISFPIIDKIDQIVIQGHNGQQIKEILEPEQIEKIINYINQYRNRWRLVVIEPMPQIEIRMYRDHQLIAYFAIGGDFFERTTKENKFYYKSANQQQTREIINLLGLPISMLDC